MLVPLVAPFALLGLSVPAHGLSTGYKAIARSGLPRPGFGSAAIYSGGAAAPANAISHVASGAVYVRYVSKRDDWAMADLAPDASPQFPYGIQWGFFPRSCLTAH